MKERLIAKKQELEAKKEEIANANIEETIAELVAAYKADLEKCYAEKIAREVAEIDIKISVVDEMIAECDLVEKAAAVEETEATEETNI